MAVENNKPDVIENLKKLTENEDKITGSRIKNISILRVQKDILFMLLLKRKLILQCLPADGGCIVDNVDTIYNIYQCC
ncbi:MAG: hypothetical protein ACLUR5_14710 [Eubacterium ventriosum]